MYLVVGVEDVEELRLLPHGVSSQNEIFLVLAPVHIPHREVVVLGHLERALALVDSLLGFFVFLFDV